VEWQLSRVLRFLAILVLLGLGLAVALLRDAREMLRTPLAIGKPEVFEVVKGHSLDAVIADLHAKGWLPAPRARLYLRGYVRLKPELAAVKAGEYQLTMGTSALDLLALFASGKVILHELLIVEGWRFDQALEAVKRHPALAHTLPPEADGATVMKTLGRAGEDAEGRFFPDTYRFPRGTTDVAYLKRALAAGDNALQEEWEGREGGLPYKTPYEALVMASIVERETAVPDERAAIAGVFVRRLAMGMRLQTDPTVIYGMGTRFDGNLRKRDLSSNSPYNTYMRAGLPPTPICLPGRASLHAALHPAPGDALYFVARGDGSHQFSSKLQDHEAAVRRYQLGRQP
jgi:UPF0755 protein